MNRIYIYVSSKVFFGKKHLGTRITKKNGHKNIITNILLRSIIVGRDLFNIYDRTL